jgi:hypothetical protein
MYYLVIFLQHTKYVSNLRTLYTYGAYDIVLTRQTLPTTPNKEIKNHQPFSLFHIIIEKFIRYRSGEKASFFDIESKILLHLEMIQDRYLCYRQKYCVVESSFIFKTGHLQCPVRGKYLKEINLIFICCIRDMATFKGNVVITRYVGTIN